jgi:hypothetical protein
MPDADTIVRAALAAFPADPNFPDAREAITGYEVFRDDGEPADRDPNVPVEYWVFEIGDADPVARAVAAAVLRVVADWRPDTTHPAALVPAREQLLALAEEIARA